jgi:glutamate--cysteine ligase
MRDELCQFVQQLNRHSAPLGIAWIGLGLQPLSLRDSIPWVPKARYGVMSAHLGRTGRLAHDMMKRTAGIQVNFDYASEADAAAKFRALMAHSAVITALFANSPLSGGEPTGQMSTRAAIWLETDPARCGLLELAFQDRPFFPAYLDYALDVPCMFVVRDGHWHDVGGKTFRRFLREGHTGLVARQADWELHLTTLFPDVRMKRFLEARFADSGDASLAMAQVALIKGIVYDETATAQAWDLIRHLTWEQRLALHRDAARLGLEASAGDTPLLEIAAELVRVARAGLVRQATAEGIDETEYLAPLDVILGDGESPARRLLRLWDGELGHDPSKLVSHLASVNIDCYTC